MRRNGKAITRCLSTSTLLGAPNSSASPSSTPPKAPKPRPSAARRRVVDISLIGAGLVGISALLYTQSSSAQEAPASGQAAPLSTSAASNKDQTFTLQIPGSNSFGQSTKTLTMLSMAQAEAKLHEHQAAWTITRPGNNIVSRWDTSFLASNSPIEDDHAVSVITRDPSSEVKGDLLMFGVFDGHSGWQTSKHLSEYLIPYVSRELQGVFNATPEYEALRVSALQEMTEGASAKSKVSLLQSLLKGNGLRRSSDGDVRFTNLDEDPNIVAAALKNAFLKLDKDISDKPLNLMNKTKESTSTIPSATDLQSVLPALSGACALLSVIDTARNRISVAVTGDSRAVMGIWDTATSKWKVDVLTDDQTGRNMKEVARMQKEHPEAEKNTVVSQGRVLGHLEPTRAFGDNRYKWPVGMYNKVLQYFNLPRRGDPRNYLSPPYVTAEPVVTTRNLESIDAKGTKKPKRFLVMATDGLFDELENDTIVGLVGAHIDGVRKPQSEPDLLKRVTPDANASSSGHVPATKRNGRFLFVDGNLSTHLIRNALGGQNTEHFRGLLSIPSPLSRRYRDDISVVVVLMDDAEKDNKNSLMGISAFSPDAHMNRAKL